MMLGIAAIGNVQAPGPDFETRIAAIKAEVVRDPSVALRQAQELEHASAALPGRSRTLTSASAMWLAAEALLRMGRGKEATAQVDRAIPLVENVAPSSKLMGDLLIARGGAASTTGNIQGALANYQRAYRVFGTAAEPRGQAIALQDIGTIYRDAGDYRSALKYNRQSIEIYGKDPGLLLSAYNNSGNALIELKQSRAAAAEYMQALRAADQLRSATLRTRVLQNLARAQADAGDYRSADATLRRGFEAATGPAADWRPALFGVAAMIALKRGQLDDAERLIDRTFAGAETAQAAMPMRDFHLTAYEIFRRLGETGRAIDHLEKFKRLDDQARALAASTNAALMSARFDFTNQNLKIAQRDSAIDAARVRLREVVTQGLLAAAVVISTLLTIGFVSLARSRNQVRAANATLRITNDELERALASRTEFLATTSHEIRTPLNGILGMTQVILADRAVDPTLRERIGLIHGAGETMRALVDDILDMAKVVTGELQIHPDEMDLRRLLGDAAVVWQGQAVTKDIGIALDLEHCPGAIVADEVRLRQIIFNLMSNAIKFTDRGQVKLAATALVGEEGERLCIRIEDSGIGIPADKLAEIFESFRQVDGGTTRRHGGTGLGLAICRSLARAMGGDVSVSSIVGAGSTFTLDLPLEHVHATSAIGVERATITLLADAQLLLVEANPLSQGIMRAVIAPNVAGLRVAGDGGDAENALAAGDIDHVVADGATLRTDVDAALRLCNAATTARARITLLWPAPDAETIAILSRAGAQVIAKPIAAADLLAALRMGYNRPVAPRDIAA